VIDVDLNAASVPLAWAELFGRQGPTELEIGSGKGRFLLGLARDRPQVNHLAVERAAKYHQLVCERAARRGLNNVRLLRTTAEDLLFRLLAPASLRAVYVLFPDPWPKKRHHKRRLISPHNARALLEVLEPAGRLLVKTDHPAYGDVIAEVLAGLEDVDHLDADREFAELPESGFERKYLDQGRSIRSFALAKRER
jgi:tRNA (guanine-N7-)-methyltransferase